jgi:hypothetical protein
LGDTTDPNHISMPNQGSISQNVFHEMLVLWLINKYDVAKEFYNCKNLGNTV